MEAQAGMTIQSALRLIFHSSGKCKPDVYKESVCVMVCVGGAWSLSW